MSSKENKNCIKCQVYSTCTCTVHGQAALKFCLQKSVFFLGEGGSRVKLMALTSL